MISYVVRPPLFCARCGSAMQQTQHNATRREIWCSHPNCDQYDQHIMVNDPLGFQVRVKDEADPGEVRTT